MATVGLGIALFESPCGTTDAPSASSYRILWVYVGFVAFLLMLQGILFALFTIVSLNTDDPTGRPV